MRTDLAAGSMGGGRCSRCSRGAPFKLGSARVGTRTLRRAPLVQPELSEEKSKETPLADTTAGFGAETQTGVADSLTAAEGAKAKTRLSASAVTWRPSPVVALQAEPLPSPVA